MSGGWAGIWFVAVGGGLGAVSRYGIGALLLRYPIMGTFSPLLGTVIANLLGCALMGVALAWFETWASTSAPLSSTDLARIKLFAATGFLGALTTFSTYGADCLYLFKHHSLKTVLAYMALGNGLGLLGLYMAYVVFSQLFQNSRT